ncbi:Alpha/Beta hydrolase protein [Dichotomopilus funicola]|uniref:Carboxylic ester hydrolase n=1 Tax=Dichotomopilus funicola TaxID=1934379 RepID=A0AAN6UWY2_9PEZI|nr:Alpha/Beta hydrolase protein [Dichotomopilus funicola]
MKLLPFLISTLPFLGSGSGHPTPIVSDTHHQITYHGLERNNIEVFLGIPYGQNTGGPARFKPPTKHVPPAGSRVNATAYGPSCPQLGEWAPPLLLANITHMSEDCLNLNVARPKGTRAGERLPVMVFIHGGGLFKGDNHDPTILPDRLVRESVENGSPVVHVALNYRLGVFGFARSDALKAEKAENNGLRDQRLALEWVRDNIAHFGGNPDEVTVFGQSSGGLSVSLQLMAYGATKPVPFHQAIAQSQMLEPGIAGNYTLQATQMVADHVGCNTTALSSPATITCLRNLDTRTLLDASLATYSETLHLGEIWLPTVDGDFIPAKPSTLLRTGRFANVTTMIGWCQDDTTVFTDPAIQTEADVRAFFSLYIPALSESNMDKLLSLYPPAEFTPPSTPSPSPNILSTQFFRAARIFRDILMTCPPLAYGSHLSAAGNDVYLYNWNQTILAPILEQVIPGTAGWGPIHTSEFAYMFGNLERYDTNGFVFEPTGADYDLVKRGTRSWANFAATGRPGAVGRETFQGFGKGFDGEGGEDVFVYVVGGEREGLTAVDGEGATEEMRRQRLRERCAFLNGGEVVEQFEF